MKLRILPAVAQTLGSGLISFAELLCDSSPNRHIKNAPTSDPAADGSPFAGVSPHIGDMALHLSRPERITPW